MNNNINIINGISFGILYSITFTSIYTVYLQKIRGYNNFYKEKLYIPLMISFPIGFYIGYLRYPLVIFVTH